MRAGAGPYAFDRRRLLTGAAAGVAVAGVAGLGGWLLSGSKDAELARRGVARMLPRAARPAAPIPAGADLRISGLTPFVTPNAEFYRVDTALVVPSVDPARWTLKIHGLVDRPVELTFADLLKRPLTEADVTLTCVSNEVGGPYAGNARWLGARLADVLREAGIRREADMLLSVSEDGWTCGTPVDVVMDGRDALLAVAMNGEVLPEAHGFPVRQVVPGLYGYVSATKWVTEIRVTRFDRDEAYWTPRGWAPRGPIKTQSRIDLPRDGDEVTAGRTTVAGVAWAQHRGVDAVEVRVDGGAWRQARLADVPGPDTWRQWSLDLDLTPGRHTISVRATDATGYTQTADEVPPAPDGATGLHTVTVTAR
ncbi:molybdopterin-dependent oxidoreductase [Microbispora sp. GKU 823]|uniref:molybdopterin-dependent oxidoreductase n=1 Tax=Microbispora sp. GKU 823 TaxID=1652100 RepID=UPI00277B55F4|nr:molybdopterin-dependent oxidoreductase [Microbispora sp. GKU 823]